MKNFKLLLTVRAIYAKIIIEEQMRNKYGRIISTNAKKQI